VVSYDRNDFDARHNLPPARRSAQEISFAARVAVDTVSMVGVANIARDVTARVRCQDYISDGVSVCTRNTVGPSIILDSTAPTEKNGSENGGNQSTDAHGSNEKEISHPRVSWQTR
jgi:hypothetical protein